DVPALVALLVGGEEVFAAILDPLDRSPEPAGAHRDGRIFRIDRALGAKPAAHIRRNNAHLVVRQVEQVEETALDAVRALAGYVHEIGIAGLVVAGDEPARFHGERPAAVKRDALAKNVGRARKRRVGLAMADR